MVDRASQTEENEWKSDSRVSAHAVVPLDGRSSLETLRLLGLQSWLPTLTINSPCLIFTDSAAMGG